jgi:isopenicillin N synthase-like dioxygenase
MLLQKARSSKVTLIPRIDIGPLFREESPARRAADTAILAAAKSSGFMTVMGLPAQLAVGRQARKEILRVFTLSEAAKRKLYRQKFDPARANVYRGWFPLQRDTATFKEGIDIGPDCAYGAGVVDATDPLREATPLPEEAELPGWRDAVARYYRDMEQTGQAIMRGIARALGLPERTFDEAFQGGISTLRLIHYPPRTQAELDAVADKELWTEHNGKRIPVSGKAHVDSGFVTLLAQDGVPGLQALSASGEWIDVPPEEGSLAVNFGKLLDRWTGGRIKATEHRVVGGGPARYSLPFFYEPRAEAMIAPLPLEGASPFEPFCYGEHLWAAMTRFVEFRGMEGLRKPTRAA